MNGKIGISFIGAGNLAWHLAPALDNAGFSVNEVYSRDFKNAKALTKRLYQAQPSKSLDFSESDATLFIIAVSDTAIASVSQEVVLPEGAVLAHTSGSQPLSQLSYAAAGQTAVFYPLQTFTKSKNVQFEDIPILLECEDKQTLARLRKIAQSISNHVATVSSADRKALHVAAVFACNFTNHMMYIAQSIMQQNKMDPSLLHPLIVETMKKSLSIGPEKAQTGPALREDIPTLEKHMAYLSGHEGWSSIYKAVTQDILDTYQQ